MKRIVAVVVVALSLATVAWALDFQTFKIAGLDRNSDEAALIARFGQPELKTKPTFWPATGEWTKEYKWPSKGMFVTLGGDSAEAAAWKISAIEVKAPFAGKTDKGIGIGSTSAQVQAAYGKPAESTAASLFYTEGDCCAQAIFTLKNDKVAAIWFGPTPE